MAALLWKGCRQVARSAAWSKLHPSIAFAFLCVWADRMASSIASANADPSKAAENIRRTEPADLTSAFPVTLPGAEMQACTLLGDDEVLVGALVGSILPYVTLKDLPEDLKARLLATIGNAMKEVWCPQFQIAFQRLALPGAWIANDPVAAVIASGAVHVLSPFTERDLDRCVQAVLVQQINPDHPFLITGILVAADLSSISSETAEAVIAYVEKLLIAYDHLSNDAGFRHAQCIRAECLGVTGNSAEMTSTITKLASLFAATHRHQKTGYVVDPEYSPAQRDLVLLLELAIAYARHLPGSRVDKVAALADLVARIPDHWRGARNGAIEFLDRSTTMLDSEAVAALWPALLRARQNS